MPSSAARASEASRHLEQVDTLLTTSSPSPAALTPALDSARSSCAAILLQDFACASAEKVEDRLWTAHVKVNTHYRAELRKLKDGGNTGPVERRKRSADYLKFIKSSQKFFRTYIRSLDQTYGNIEELHRLAGKLGPNDGGTISAQHRNSIVDDALRRDVLSSSYRTLVQLGDLSRYRESELAEQMPNWSFAVGYYDLARSIVPSSGVAFNQLAIVALADGNLFQATYYLFRSLSVPERHPQAESNLRKAFFKISSSWEKGELIASASALVAWHLRLVSKCYFGKAFAEQPKLEREVSSRLATELTNMTLAATVRKLFLINFAASFTAQEHFTSDPNTEGSLQAYTHFLRINMVCMCTLFTSLRYHIRAPAGTDSRTPPSSKVPTNVKKLLPLVRLSVLWMMKNIRVLTNPVSASVDELQPKLWGCMAECLAAALKAYDVEHLPESKYLFDEEEDTIAFAPLLCDQTRQTWYQRDGKVRPSIHDNDVDDCDSNITALAQMRIILRSGIQFAVDKRVPMQYDIEAATFRCETPNSSASEQPEEALPGDEQSHMIAQQDLHSAGDEIDEDAERMVSSLVGTMQPSQQSESPLVDDITQTPVYNGRQTASDLVLTMQNSNGRSTRGDSGNAASQIGSRGSPWYGPLREVRTPGLQQPSAYRLNGLQPGSRPGSGSNAESAFTNAMPMTPDRSVEMDNYSTSATGALGQSYHADSGHSHGPSMDSNHSAPNANDPRNNHLTSGGPGVSGVGAMSSVMGLGNGTFGGQSWASNSPTGHAIVNPFLSGTANSPWSVAGQGPKRLSAGSPTLAPEPALRHESGYSPGTIGARRNSSRPPT